MPIDHFLAMTLYAVLTGAFFTLLWKQGKRERTRYFLVLLVALVAGAVAAGWVMYPFPAHP